MKTRGFTLLEVMVVVALIGIIASLAFNSMEELRARTAPRTAAAEFTTAMSQARNRALSRGSDVWVIIYPSQDSVGAWFIYEDVTTNFGTSTASSTVRQYLNFTPTNRFPMSGENNRLIDSGFLRDYAKRNVRFSTTSSVGWGNPFTGLASESPQSCTFCTAGPSSLVRGAIVFTGDGSALFYDGNGARLAKRAVGLTLNGVTTDQPTRVAVSGSTGYVGVFQ